MKHPTARPLPKGWIRMAIALAFVAYAFPSDREQYIRDRVDRAIHPQGGLESQLPGPNPAPILKASDFGLSAGATPEANAAALSAIGVALSNRPASGLRFEPGVYRVQLRKGQASLAIFGQTNFTLDGNGARLVFRDSQGAETGYISYLDIRDSQRLLVRDLSLVWDWDASPMGVVAQVEEVNGGAVRFKVLSGGALAKGMLIKNGREWDLATENRSPRGYAPSFSQAAEILDARSLEFRGMTGAPPQVGQASLLRITTRFHGDGVALRGDNDHLSFSNLNLLGVPDTAFTGYSRHLTIRDCTLAPPRTGLYKSSEDVFTGVTAPCFVFERNRISFSGDDVMNSSFGRLGEFLGGGLLPEGEKSLVADRLQFYASRDVIQTGRRVFIANGLFEPGTWASKVADFTWQKNFYPDEGKNPRNRCLIRFADAVPPLDPANSKDALLMFDYGEEGGYLIRDNIISNTRCHGFWLGNGPGLIEKNRFYQTGYPALGVLMTIRWKRWYKGFYPEGLILRENEMVGCNTALRQPADLYVGAAIDENRPNGFVPVPTPIVANVIIERNRITGSAQGAIGVFSASNVSILGNIILSPGREALDTSRNISDGALFVLDSRDVRIRGNRISHGTGASVNGIKVERSREVVVEGNREE